MTIETIRNKRKETKLVEKEWIQFCSDIMLEFMQDPKYSIKINEDKSILDKIENDYRQKLRDSKTIFCDKMQEKYLDLYNEKKISLVEMNNCMETIDKFKEAIK